MFRIAYTQRLASYAFGSGEHHHAESGIVALCAAPGGCVSNNETIAFKASNPQQQAMMRDGQPALVSRQKNSLVLVRPASRQLQANGRPVFVVGINNVGRQQVEAIQHVCGSDFGMQIVTFEMLQQEEKNRQVARAASVGHLRGAVGVRSAGHASEGDDGGVCILLCHARAKRETRLRAR